MRNILTNDGNPSGVNLPNGAYGFVVVTVVQGVGQPADQNGEIIGNFRVIDNAGYEYRANSQGFSEGDPIGGQYHINYTTAGGITRSDIVGITVNNLTSGEVTAGGSSVTFDTNIYNENEIPFSCSDTTFSCTEDTFEYGINNAIPHSRDKALLCDSNNVPEGFVKLETIVDTDTEAFAGFAGINTGNNSRGSMDSLIAVRTIICGDSILDGGQGETCEPPGEEQPNGNVCRFDCTFCGDENLDEGQGETCDPPGELQPPNDNECRDDCTFCGDGLLDEGQGETCDPPGEPQPPNDNDCRDDCTFCGDGMLDEGEDCDDGNDVRGDGCENDCTISPDGACCFPDTSCGESQTLNECSAAGGEYQGDNVICADVDCPIPPPPPPDVSDCCFSNETPFCDDPDCQELVCAIDPYCCDTEWDGICVGEAIELCGDLCPQPPDDGACCLSNGECSEPTTEDECNSEQGAYQGDGTICSSVDCRPTGACCIRGQCSDDQFQIACGRLGGEYQGDGTICSSVDCRPTGACCIQGQCSDDQFQTECGRRGGEYQGDGTICSSTECTPTGACCIQGQCSDQVPESACIRQGEYQGDGTICNSQIFCLID